MNETSTMLATGAANAAVSEVIANMALITDVNERYLCALEIWEVATSQPVFKAALGELAPALMSEVQAAALESGRRASLKGVCKGVDAAGFLRDSINRAKAMSPEQAAIAARRDAAEVSALMYGGPGFLLSSILDDMAVKRDNNSAYMKTIMQESPSVAVVLAGTIAPKFLTLQWEVPMQSMAGYKMVYNGEAGMAGAEVVLPDRSRICLGNRETIEAFALENSLSQADFDCLVQLDSLVDVHELRMPSPVVSNDVNDSGAEVSCDLVVPEGFSTFLRLLLAGASAAVDVNEITGECVCHRSIHADTNAQGSGTVLNPLTTDWHRVATCEEGSLSVDKAVLHAAVLGNPMVVGALVDYEAVTAGIASHSLRSAFSIADPNSEIQHCGDVVAVSVFFVGQSAGRGNFVLHELASLDQRPMVGHAVEIKYKAGLGAVVDRTVTRESAVVER